MGNKGLRVKDIHTDQHTITATSAKGCNARPGLKISEELTARIKTLINERYLRTEDSVFTGHERRYGEHFRRARNNLANKLQMPELRNIRFYDLRHYYVQLRVATKLSSETFSRSRRNLNLQRKSQLNSNIREWHRSRLPLRRPWRRIHPPSLRNK
jgi:hypothetical protein